MAQMNAGKLIKMLRERAGLSQKQFAIKINSTQGTVSQWERNGALKATDLERCLNGLGYELVARKIRKEDPNDNA